MSSDSACAQYGNGWCCTSGASIATLGSYEIQIFSVILSIMLIIMLIFILVKIGIHYYYLHTSNIEPKQTETQQAKEKTKIQAETNSKYLTFAENIQPPSPAPLPPQEKDIQTSDGDFSTVMEDTIEFTDQDTFSADYIMELPDRQNSQSSLIKVYRQYEKQLGVGSKFLEKRNKIPVKPTMRGFHFIYLLLIAAWLLVQCVVLLTKSQTSTTARVIDAILYISHG